DASVTEFRLKPVPAFVNVTVTPGSTAPEGSRTVPRMSPLSRCAQAEAVAARRKKAAARIRRVPISCSCRARAGDAARVDRRARAQGVAFAMRTGFVRIAPMLEGTRTGVNQGTHAGG